MSWDGDYFEGELVLCLVERKKNKNALGLALPCLLFGHVVNTCVRCTSLYSVISGTGFYIPTLELEGTFCVAKRFIQQVVNKVHRHNVLTPSGSTCRSNGLAVHLSDKYFRTKVVQYSTILVGLKHWLFWLSQLNRWIDSSSSWLTGMHACMCVSIEA